MKEKRSNITSLCIGMLCIFLAIPIFAHPLTLAQAERVAIRTAPDLQQLHAKQEAFSQTAIAAGQLPDPKLMLNAMNLPTDTFNINQEAMTQLQVGIQQRLPKGRTLTYRAQQQHDLARAEHEKGRVVKVAILRTVRLNWLNLYYWLRARTIVKQQKQIFRHLIKVTESLVANNKAQQKDLIRAQLELNELDNRLIGIRQQIDTARINLARWIGIRLAKQAQPRRLPHWPNPANFMRLYQQVYHHPELGVDRAKILADQSGVMLAKQQFWPGITLGAAYGFRQGYNANNSHRADLFTAQASIDLPIFPRNRQSRQLQASAATLVASEDNQMIHTRELKKALRTHYTNWVELQKSTHLYQSLLIPEAKQYAEATQVAYQNDQTDFPTLARAYIRELETKLAGLKTAVDHSKARIYILYLQGK